MMAKRVPNPGRKRRRQGTLQPLKMIEVKCAFCRGKGNDPFGVMSRFSTCCVCGGKGTVVVGEPYVVCRSCSGTGVEPFTRLTCLGCKGKGVIPVGQVTEICPVCNGTGLHTSHLYCLRCHGAGVVSPVSADGSMEGAAEAG